MMSEVRLVRHPEVAVRWRERCYGASDVGLSRDGQRRATEIVHGLAAWRPDAVVWSGLRRTALARALARRAGVPLIADARWRERDFGAWEGRTWNSIYRATGNAMDGMLTDPGAYRPGGGETTGELWARVKKAWGARPCVARLVIVTHGGPIAVVRAMQTGAPLSSLPRFICAPASVVPLRLAIAGDQSQERLSEGARHSDQNG